jgi:hypothetical protein
MIERRRHPSSAALDRARALLLDLVARDRAGPLAAGLEWFESWESLASLAETPWLSASRRPTGIATRVVRQRLRLLGSAPSTFAAAVAKGSADPVHLRGICASIPGGGRRAELWRREATVDETGRWGGRRGV